MRKKRALKLLEPEEVWAEWLTEKGLAPFERQFLFCDNRLWRFDFAWPKLGVAVEIEGGVWVNGRHIRPSGFIKDMEKYNTAAILGWKVLRYLPKQVGAIYALTEIKMAMKNSMRELELMRMEEFDRGVPRKKRYPNPRPKGRQKFTRAALRILSAEEEDEAQEDDPAEHIDPPDDED